MSLQGSEIKHAGAILLRVLTPSLKVLKNKGWIDCIDFYGCFHWKFKYSLDE